jgi:hypothetical protein
MPDVLTAVLDSTVLVSACLTEGGVSAALLWRFQVFRLEYFQYLSPKHWDIIGGCCPDNLPLHGEVCMHGNVTEGNNIAPFYLWVGLTKGLREVGGCFTNHGELLEGGGLM